jgi:membrane-bound lytic murein transglycosylase B
MMFAAPFFFSRHPTIGAALGHWPRRLACAVLSVCLGLTLLPATATTERDQKPRINKRAAQERARLPDPSRDVQILYADRPDVMAQIKEISERRQLDAAWVEKVLGQAQQLPLVARLVLPPAVGIPKNWTAYRERFIEPIRINSGVLFWQANAKALARAEQTYGVPAQLIVGIIGVETLYGRNMGNFRVIDALATLAFDFPKEHPRALARQQFFRDELESYLTICQRNGTDPLRTKGSYAGAIGLPQFMPSSIAKYAIDFDGDGKIDLQNSVTDAIGSVAHYLQAFKWQPGMPTHYALQFSSGPVDVPALLGPDIVPTFQAADLSAKGVLLSTDGLQHVGKLALIELQNGGEAPSYVVGTDNFYAITRYNWSSYYAMAVIELGKAVAEKMIVSDIKTTLQ